MVYRLSKGGLAARFPCEIHTLSDGINFVKAYGS